LGGTCVFRTALIRRPLKKWKPFKRASGPREGIQTENIPWEIYVICSNGPGIDVQSYHQLCTCIDMEGMMDLLEMREVHESWKHAEMHNKVPA